MLLRIFSGSACLVGVITLRWQNYPPVAELPSGDGITLPVQLRPPEMGIVVDIGVLCRDWEGGFALGGWNGARA